MVTLATQVKTLRTENIRVSQELQDFKDKVKQVTLDYPAGCEEGKRKFLEKLGLEDPILDASVVAQIEFDVPGDIIQGMMENYDYSYEDALDLIRESSYAMYYTSGGDEFEADVVRIEVTRNE